jgi:hypothetical protein
VRPRGRGAVTELRALARDWTRSIMRVGPQGRGP